MARAGRRSASCPCVASGWLYLGLSGSVSANLRGGALMGPASDFSHIPIIDVRDLVASRPTRAAVAERLGAACRESGFFYVVGHGVDEALQARLRELSRAFFAQDVETKLKIRMALGGRAW